MRRAIIIVISIIIMLTFFSVAMISVLGYTYQWPNNVEPYSIYQIDVQNASEYGHDYGWVDLGENDELKYFGWSATPLIAGDYGRSVLLSLSGAEGIKIVGLDAYDSVWWSESYSFNAMANTNASRIFYQKDTATITCRDIHDQYVLAVLNTAPEEWTTDIYEYNSYYTGTAAYGVDAFKLSLDEELIAVGYRYFDWVSPDVDGSYFSVAYITDGEPINTFINFTGAFITQIIPMPGSDLATYQMENSNTWQNSWIVILDNGTAAIVKQDGSAVLLYVDLNANWIGGYVPIMTDLDSQYDGGVLVKFNYTDSYKLYAYGNMSYLSTQQTSEASDQIGSVAAVAGMDRLYLAGETAYTGEGPDDATVFLECVDISSSSFLWRVEWDLTWTPTFWGPTVDFVVDGRGQCYVAISEGNGPYVVSSEGVVIYDYADEVTQTCAPVSTPIWWGIDSFTNESFIGWVGYGGGYGYPQYVYQVEVDYSLIEVTPEEITLSPNFLLYILIGTAVAIVITTMSFTRGGKRI